MLGEIIEICKLPAFLGIAFGIRKVTGFERVLICTLKKVLRCSCPREKGKRSRKFLRMLNHFLKIVKTRTGWNCRRQRLALRPVATTLDKIIDNIRELKNPFYFYSFDEELSMSVNNVLSACRVHRPLPYKLVLPPWKVKEVRKIAEGSYGEIYTSKSCDGRERILKIITVHGNPRDNPEQTSDLEDAVGDAVCSKHLSTLASPGVFYAPNFPKAYNIHLVKGKPPKFVVEAWQRFKDDPNTEETTHFKPDRYSKDSLFLIMELENCGRQFLNQHFLDSLQALSLILQTASALAVAECAFGFEHRDLHMGNWLSKDTTETYITYSTPTCRWKVPTFKIKAFIIDFTMSRIEIEGNTFAMDLSSLSNSEVLETEPGLFNHNSVYNKMKEELGDDFNTFLPQTNIWWLTHLCCNVHARLKEQFHGIEREMSDSDKTALYALERLKDNMMRYSTTMEFLQAEVFGFQ